MDIRPSLTVGLLTPKLGLGPTRPGIETSSLAGRLDLHVLEEYRTAGIHDFARLYAAENTVYKNYVINHGAGKTRDPHHAWTGSALNIFEVDVAHDRFVGRPGPADSGGTSLSC